MNNGNFKEVLKPAKDISIKIADSFLKNFIENDAMLKKIFDNEILKSIPYLQTIIAAFNTGKNYKEWMLKRKIYDFLNNINISKDEAEKFISKIEKKDNFNDIGIRIIEIIDKMDDSNKAALVGKLFALFIKEEIKQNQYFRVCYILNKCFYEDLIYLKKFTDRKKITANNDIMPKGIIENLFSYGLLNTDGQAIKTYTKGIEGKNYGTVYELNDYGKIITQVI